MRKFFIRVNNFFYGTELALSQLSRLVCMDMDVLVIRSWMTVGIIGLTDVCIICTETYT